MTPFFADQGTRKQVPVRSAAAIASAGIVLLAAGCGTKSTSLPPAQYLSDSLQQDPPVTADLTKPFAASTADLEQGEDAGLPVAAAKAFASSAGGTWVVLAPDALDPVKGFASPQPQMYGSPQPTVSVSDKIDAIRTAGTPIAYDTTHGYVYMVFGSQTDLAKLRAAPPNPITGLYIGGNDLITTLHALADSRGEKITVDPALDTAWNAYKLRNKQLQTNIMLAQSSSMSGMYEARLTMMGGQPANFEYSNVRRSSEADIMNAIAKSIGGSAIQAGPGQWKIDSYAPGDALNAQIKGLSSSIDQAAGIGADTSDQDAGAGTSYAERHGQVESSGNTFDITTVTSATTPEAIEQLQVMMAQYTTPNPSVSTALDQLGVIGAPALPTLVEYLSPTTPPAVTADVLRVLACEPASNVDARSELYKFMASTISTPAKTGKEIQRLALINYSVTLIDAASKIDGSLDRQAQSFLSSAASSADLPQSLRTQSRFLLLRYGIMPPATAPAWNPAGELSFQLTPPPAGHGLLSPITPPVPGAIRPLATTVLPNGDAWAVFVSGRLGNSSDLWLAHSSVGVWREFLFTGKEYQTAQNSGVDNTLQPGGCGIAVIGDTVTLLPGSSEAAAKFAAFQTTMQKMQQSDPSKAAKMWAQYSQMQQAAGSSLSIVYKLQLSQLRKDADGDGLPDLVEQRLGTNPTIRDTMNSGTADGANQNPLVSSAAGWADHDRQELLQQVFSAMFGSDSTPDPIVVVLDKPFQQAFHGSAARVLCLTPPAYVQSGPNFSTLRCLQFGGATDPTATILHSDGPCLLSDNGNRAEVHFWIASQAQQFFGRIGMTGTDYVAKFHRDGDKWQLDSMDTWHFKTSNAGNPLSSIIQN